MIGLQYHSLWQLVRYYKDNGMIRWNCGAGKHVYINGLSFQLREIRISHIFAKINFATGSQKMLSFVKRTDIRQFREKFKKFSPFCEISHWPVSRKKCKFMNLITFFVIFRICFLWTEWEKCMFICPIFQGNKLIETI